MTAIVTLTTDFGLTDGYVAVMKGVILGINPEVTLVDVTHQIKPHNIQEAAFVLSTIYPHFPPKTIHLVVVDPGVGTGRRAIILRTPLADFIAPDNGILSYVIQQFFSKTRKTGRITSNPRVQAVSITNNQYFRSPISSTFHGRDIFAPVAAYLSKGVSPSDFGEPITTVTTIPPLPPPSPSAGGSLIGEIIHIDNFANLITNFKKNDLPPELLSIEVGGKKIRGIVHSYTEGENLVAIMGSNGHLEIAVKEGNAADYLGAKVGDKVKIHPK